MSARITPFDSFAGAVSAIRVRLAPIDVGFDLRGEGIAVDVPDDVTIASYADVDGERYVVEGTADEVRAALREAGYRVAQTS